MLEMKGLFEGQPVKGEERLPVLASGDANYGGAPKSALGGLTQRPTTSAVRWPYYRIINLTCWVN